MSNALTTKARIKDRLTITNTGFDTLFDNLIAGVTERIETMTGRSFTLATYTNELHDGGDLLGSKRTILIAKNAPISTITNVQYKAGSNTTPNWTDFNADTYTIDYDAGMIYFDTPLPSGMRNVRITYLAGWQGFDSINESLWSFDVTPTGTVNGTNATFTLAENAEEVLVYADGVRLQASDVTHTAGSDTITLAAGVVPHSTIAVDFKKSTATAGATAALPAVLVDLCERAVVYLFKNREKEGRTTETFAESSTTWRDSMFTKEMLATINNYRRGYDL